METEDFLNEICNFTEKEKNCGALIDSGAIVTRMNNK